MKLNIRGVFDILALLLHTVVQYFLQVVSIAFLCSNWVKQSSYKMKFEHHSKYLLKYSFERKTHCIDCNNRAPGRSKVHK